MKQLGLLGLILVLLAAACQPATTSTPTTLPTAVVTELPTGGDDTGAEATEAADTTGAEATGEPASATEVSAVTGASTAEATADLAAMMPGDYCIEIAGLDEGEVVMRLNDGTYTYEFEGMAGAESDTGAAPNVVAAEMHTLRFTNAGGTHEFVLNFSDDISLGSYPIGTAQLANMAGGAVLPEATADGTQEFNAGTGQNAPNTSTGAGGAGSSASAGANAGEATAEATDEADTSGGAGGSGADTAGMDAPITLTGACADAMREAGMEATTEAGDTMATAEAAADTGELATAEATDSAGGEAAASAATQSPLDTPGTEGDAAAETIPAPAAVATATGASATVIASGSDTEATAEATGDAGLQTTPASPAEPSGITTTTIIGARLEPAGGEGTSYIVLEDGTLEITSMDQQTDVTVLSGRFMFTLASAEDSSARVTVSGFFLNLPVNQTAR